MATEYAALCTEFFINSRLEVKLDLPTGRDTLLALVDRMRRQRPRMNLLRRYDSELLLETDPGGAPYEWMSIRRTSVRGGVENPDSISGAYDLHRELIELSPFFLSISPLDIESLELAFGFDFEVEVNRNEVIYEALFAGSPMARLHDPDQERLTDCQPLMALAVDDRCGVEITVEVRSRTTTAEIRADEYQPGPVSVLARIRDERPIDSLGDAPERLVRLAAMLERFTDDRLIPHVIAPLRQVIMQRPG